MKKFVIDASALIGIIEGNEAVLALYRKMIDGEIELVAPEFLLIEFANVMKVGKKMSRDDVGATIKRLGNSGIRFVKVGIYEIDLMVEEAFSGGLTLYDAIYVQLARKLNFRLITEDKRILELADIAIKPGETLGITE